MARLDNYQQRFGGIARLYGQSALELLRQKHICVIGIGGVGSWAVEALARSGIGTLTLIDMDDICVTNVNRQIHALSGNIGKLKTEVMAERIVRINPECDVRVIDDFLSIDNIAEYLSQDYDYVIGVANVEGKSAKILAISLVFLSIFTKILAELPLSIVPFTLERDKITIERDKIT